MRWRREWRGERGRGGGDGSAGATESERTDADPIIEDPQRRGCKVRTVGTATPLILTRTRGCAPGSTALHNKPKNRFGKQNCENSSDCACRRKDTAELSDQSVKFFGRFGLSGFRRNGIVQEDEGFVSRKCEMIAGRALADAAAGTRQQHPPVAAGGQGDHARLVPEIQHDADRLRLVLPLEAEHVLLDGDGPVGAQAEGRVLAAQGEQAAVECQDRARIVAQDLDVAPAGIGIEGEPGFGGREAGLRTALPLHGRARGIASAARLVALPGIAFAPGRDRHAREPDLVAVVQGRRAAKRQQQHRRHPGLWLADPRRDAGLVVVAEHPVRPAARRQRRLVLVDQRRHGLGVPARLDQLEVERQVGAREIDAVIGHQPLQRQVDLPDEHAFVVFLQHGAHLGHHLHHLRLVG